NKVFSGIFETNTTSSITFSSFLLCIGTALFLGLIIALTYTFKTNYTKSFVVTLATLLATVCMVIMMVNGSLGVGVAVAGTFRLVNFRLLPGTENEIVAIFLAMGTGLATGIGYLGYAAVITGVVNDVLSIYTATHIGETKSTERILQLTFPEDLDYT